MHGTPAKQVLARVFPDMTEDERRIAAGILESSEVPAPEVMRKVTGTSDFLHWIAAVDVPMSEAEREASPELLKLLDMAAFAGALRQPLVEIADAQGAAGAMAANGAAVQMMRLNNWSAWTGDGNSSAAIGLPLTSPCSLPASASAHHCSRISPGSGWLTISRTRETSALKA